ncbi:hypothetical protein A1O1_06100 [Capronia coronata CBS 617.96]|uniref:Amidase domain-containing protein n=1 Tax=Capronia coronata CBS 617.96 TaxID=1182541 RepID=W9XYU5_9EURO|nr:uncharacterized protein A1O1_06100 [Capronia coronata CBS 617.96]EXJ85732.1 hypothetical protein A1O1_06100 [Capronia coronata CBS 617.96]
MASTMDDLLAAAGRLNIKLDEAETEQYAQLLKRMKAALETVSQLEGHYQPTPDLVATPRNKLYLPKPEENPLGAWAWRFECAKANPSSSLLEGRTVCFKDNICVADVPCLVGTESFTGWVPKTDATVVTRVLDAGAIITGKAVCENLSRGAVSNTAATGPVHNPYARGYSCGGSSSGTAALVASGAVDLGVGCDQGGSIRIPASLCGLYGFKATTGLVPYTGIASNDASVDNVGPMTTTCLDNAIMLEAIAGVDGLDDRQIAGTPFPKNVPAYSQILRDTKEQGVKGMRIGLLHEGLTSPVMDAEIAKKFRAAVAVFEKLGANVETVSVPMHASARQVYSVLTKMGNHIGMLGRATGRRQVMLTDLFEKKALPYTQQSWEKLSAMSKEGLFSGEYAWQEYPTAYPKAVNLARKLTHAYDEVLSRYDLLVMPTTLTPADPLPPVNATPMEHIMASTGKTENTSPFNITGHPALAVPIGFVPSHANPNIKIPASMQIVGKFWDEATIFKAAYAWENHVDWKNF